VNPKTYEIQAESLKRFVGMSHVWKSILPNIKGAYEMNLKSIQQARARDS
jgi:hypothetical protein